MLFLATAQSRMSRPISVTVLQQKPKYEKVEVHHLNCTELARYLVQTPKSILPALGLLMRFDRQVGCVHAKLSVS